MICTLDANAIITWAAQKAGDLDVARLDALFIELSRSKGRLILPTPALAEFFVRSSAAGASAWLTALQRKQSIKLAEFDVKAAAECAAIHRRAVEAGGKRNHVKPSEAYQKVKVDRQIAAIAIVNRSDVLITDDENLRTVCEANSLRVMSVRELEIPDAARQRRIDEVPDDLEASGGANQPGAPA